MEGRVTPLAIIILNDLLGDLGFPISTPLGSIRLDVWIEKEFVSGILGHNGYARWGSEPDKNATRVFGTSCV